MNYEFLRMILKDVPEDRYTQVLEAFAAKNLELYCQTEKQAYVHVTDTSMCHNGVFCVSAADWEYAVETAKEAGLEPWLCSAEESVVVEDPAQAAEREYMRKRKIRQLECVAVIIFAILYMLVKNLIK